jgi:transcriptional regulator with PAS, ATPase and Fis domain
MSHPPNGRISADPSAQLKTADSNAGSYFPQPTVVLWEPNKRREQVVQQIIEACAALTHTINEPGEVNSLTCSLPENLALVAFVNGCSPEAESLKVIRELKGKGFKVIVYEDDIFSWPISVRCRALLNGSSLLLDSSTSDFSRELECVLRKALETEARGLVEQRIVKEEMERLGIVGNSAKMKSVFRWVIRISTLSDFSVLIKGETGTGKELIARALHSLDKNRCKGPFIAANCSAISVGLAEAELFGHRRGAFTGAESERKGLFRSADGGVLFLDEIGELSESLQAKLLRVLQEGRVLGVGFDREVPINVRVISATNKNLKEMVRQGTFREDLYHRLDVLSVEIPPLRERYEDLRPLVEHFLTKYSSLNQSGVKVVNSDFVEALEKVELSGNARQVENIVRHALLNKVDDTALCLSDLAPVVWEQVSDQNDPTMDYVVAERAGTSGILKDGPVADLERGFATILDANNFSLAKSLDYCERLFLKCALQYADGNQSQAARLIGITPRSVYNKIHKHKLNH